ncbi:MAG TPA: [protein-PII] uridylyltransferase [Polyangiaceae bacterium]|jgi:[protein-PII] uridylyltransferase|nr:[protein-PII] uridylyltransferase [Polyangiaceae bacterium]
MMAHLVPAERPLLERLSFQLVPELRRYLSQHRASVESMIGNGALEAGLPAGRRYAKIYDGLLSALFHAARTAMSVEGAWSPLSLAAVGSYGRSSLAPASDLDVRMLCEKDSASAGPAAEALLYPLWDAGLNIGHQVVTTEDVLELARRDLPTATSLLDWRTITGDSNVGVHLLERAFQGVFGPGDVGGFLDALEAKAHERHERFGGSVFLLEPDVKNGEGGLRDLDIAHWSARARWQVSDVSALVRIGVLVPREWAEIDAARGFLYRIRNLLHLSAGRRADRLSFEQQEKLADQLGYGEGGSAVERFMSDYYRYARNVARAREMILTRAKPPPRRRPRETPIGRGLKLQRDAVSLVDPDALFTDPALALRVYDEAVKRNVPVYDFARQSIARAVANPEFCESLRKSPEAAELFVRLVCVAQQTKLKRGSVLYDLHDVGLVVAMIPEFLPVVGRVHHDIYHVYTVDVHSVAAVDLLRSLCRGDLASEHPLACRLAAEISRPHALFFAALLHDIGKDSGGKHHPERGADLAKEILARLGFTEADAAEVAHHVLKHLRMYHVATRRDIDDPRTLEEFCSEVHGAEGLRELYLLTLVDVSTTSPGSMTSWKRRMLDELYVASERYLAGAPPRGPGRSEAVVKAVLEARPDGQDRAFLDHFLGALPERYLYANEPPAIAQHAAFAQEAMARPAAIRVLATSEPYVELCVVADDRPGLLAMITAAFSHAKLKVLSAQVYSWVGPDGTTRSLDMFWVRSGQEAAGTVRLVPGLERDLRLLLAGETDPVELATGAPASSRWVSRPTPPVATKINVDNRAATNHTIIEVITRDRRALLFWLSSAIQRAGLSIAFAKINTEGERVADVFYVTNGTGGKMLDEPKIEALKDHLLSTIARVEASG